MNLQKAYRVFSFFVFLLLLAGTIFFTFSDGNRYGNLIIAEVKKGSDWQSNLFPTQVYSSAIFDSIDCYAIRSTVMTSSGSRSYATTNYLISSRYFETFPIEIIHGRRFGETEADGKCIIISSDAAIAIFGKANAVGEIVYIENAGYEVVGICSRQYPSAAEKLANENLDVSYLLQSSHDINELNSYIIFSVKENEYSYAKFSMQSWEEKISGIAAIAGLKDYSDYNKAIVSLFMLYWACMGLCIAVSYLVKRNGYQLEQLNAIAMLYRVAERMVIWAPKLHVIFIPICGLFLLAKPLKEFYPTHMLYEDIISSISRYIGMLNSSSSISHPFINALLWSRRLCVAGCVIISLVIQSVICKRLLFLSKEAK